jgi:Uma2 family endonuclease
MCDIGIMSAPSKTFFTAEEYLELEEGTELKNEYRDGQIYAMPPINREHDWIGSELAWRVLQHLRGKKCSWYSSKMRLHAPASGLYTYADLSVVCGTAQFAEGKKTDTLLNPVLVVEILSPDTESYDRGRKAAMYQTISSLQELLLIAQDTYKVELLRRESDGTSSRTEAAGLDASIELQSIGFTLPLRELYERLIRETEL